MLAASRLGIRAKSPSKGCREADRIAAVNKMADAFEAFLSVSALEALIKTCPNLRIVDTRTPDEFATEHIPGATNIRECFEYLIPNTHPDGIAHLEQHFSTIFSQRGISNSPDEVVVTYEDGMSTGFAQSCRAYFLLKYLGHSRVFVLDGGFHAWKRAGHPVTAECLPIEPAQFRLDIRKHMICPYSDVQQVVSGNSEWVLLDDRDKVEWTGASSSPYGIDYTPRKGRIPGARWIEWYEYMNRDADGVWYMKTKPEIQALLQAHGVTPDQKIICYCFKGSRASHTFLCLQECGFTNIRNYFGSWNEWSRDFSLPIDDRKL
eukprot:m.49057 g.49057  ORF g.49057 m.49057 type:complete len:320 (+) comp6077_c0_seq1:382-1341(+)